MNINNTKSATNNIFSIKNIMLVEIFIFLVSFISILWFAIFYQKIPIIFGVFLLDIFIAALLFPMGSLVYVFAVLFIMGELKTIEIESANNYILNPNILLTCDADNCSQGFQ